jgi:hypothetical protein
VATEVQERRQFETTVRLHSEDVHLFLPCLFKVARKTVVTAKMFRTKYVEENITPSLYALHFLR